MHEEILTFFVHERRLLALPDVSILKISEVIRVTWCIHWIHWIQSWNVLKCPEFLQMSWNVLECPGNFLESVLKSVSPRHCKSLFLYKSKTTLKIVKSETLLPYLNTLLHWAPQITQGTIWKAFFRPILNFLSSFRPSFSQGGNLVVCVCPRKFINFLKLSWNVKLIELPPGA